MIPEEKSKKLTKKIRKANKAQDFTEIDSILNEQLEQLNKANKICAFDMEFSDRSGNNIVEIGVAIYDKSTKETYSEHYLIEEQIGKYERNNTPMIHSKMFSHGESKILPLKSAMKMLDIIMINSDVNILYANDNKNKHLQEYNFKNSSFITLQDLMRINSRNGMKMPLSLAVEEFVSTEQPINNAGNDAAVTLEIMSATIGEKIGLENYKSPIVNDYSQNENKLSASEIRKSRTKNPQPILGDKPVICINSNFKNNKM